MFDARYLNKRDAYGRDLEAHWAEEFKREEERKRNRKDHAMGALVLVAVMALPCSPFIYATCKILQSYVNEVKSRYENTSKLEIKLDNFNKNDTKK
ncbi:hypothetical protein J4456_03615 [Candidatus Pacearchaeota archaeon]|nr:hypothetical protein [Candidatus Pacearchaeota archaeon]